MSIYLENSSITNLIAVLKPRPEMIQTRAKWLPLEFDGELFTKHWPRLAAAQAPPLSVEPVPELPVCLWRRLYRRLPTADCVPGWPFLFVGISVD